MYINTYHTMDLLIHVSDMQERSVFGHPNWHYDFQEYVCMKKQDD